MRLVSFTVENYRSITKARRIGLGSSTVLIGPNNEGKSNILRALVTAMQILTQERLIAVGAKGMLRFPGMRRIYEWERDYPVHLQDKNPEGNSVLLLEFELDEAEIQEFRQEIGSNLNGTLPLRIHVGGQKLTVSVAKKGPGAKTLSSKSAKIADFVSQRLQFEYIPAIRTATSARDVVDGLVERELQPIEQDPAFSAALEQIAGLQQPVLDRLSKSIQATLVQFLPAVQHVKVEIESEQRYRALRRSCRIVINDGTPTELQYKGDGVQSLAALAIMRHASDRGAGDRNLIIAVEEPESHLHPSAIHELRRVLNELTERHQVVVSTHCPLFVDRTTVASNIIVNKRQARPARNVREIREILGTRASDNLLHAELVLLVEGEDDRIAVAALLAHCSSRLRSALEEGILALDTLAGANNLAYKVSLLRNALCLCHCFLDDDSAAREAFARCRDERILTPAEVAFATSEGRKDAEIEDMYDPSIYAQMIQNGYRVSLDSAKFRSNKKWSRRMYETFKSQAKQWDTVAAEVKMSVARLVANASDRALDPHRRSPFDSLVRDLEQRLNALHNSR